VTVSLLKQNFADSGMSSRFAASEQPSVCAPLDNPLSAPRIEFVYDDDRHASQFGPCWQPAILVGIRPKLRFFGIPPGRTKLSAKKTFGS
jgi:hypothetical protein